MNQPEMRQDSVRYVCMPGSPYTGSTLLGVLLNTHPDIASIGAATGLTRRVDIDTYRCSCGRMFTSCAFWKAVSDHAGAALDAPLDIYETGFWDTHVRLSKNRGLNGVLVRSLGDHRITEARDALVGRLNPVRQRMERARSTTYSLAAAVLEEAGKKVFVDTARDHQRPKYLAGHPNLDLRAIHLIRDPRGNVASIMGHTGVNVTKAARQWRHYNVEADRVRRYLPPDRWMRVKYEDLCANPQGTIDSIALFLGVDPAPLPEDLDAVENHIIGNSMRLRGVGEIRLDERWRESLSQSDVETITRVAGAAAREFDYEWPVTG